MRLTPLAAATALLASSAASASGFLDHAAIDREVAGFTGAAIGEAGGARMPVDRRLKLAPCPQDLALEWYGSRRETVLVRCPTSGGWRLFVPVMGGGAAAAQKAEPIVSRGEAVMIAVSGRGFTLTRQGEALEGGALGEWIRVRPAGNAREPIRARITRPGVVGMALP